MSLEIFFVPWLPFASLFTSSTRNSPKLKFSLIVLLLSSSSFRAAISLRTEFGWILLLKLLSKRDDRLSELALLLVFSFLSAADLVTLFDELGLDFELNGVLRPLKAVESLNLTGSVNIKSGSGILVWTIGFLPSVSSSYIINVRFFIWYKIYSREMWTYLNVNWIFHTIRAFIDIEFPQRWIGSAR